MLFEIHSSAFSFSFHCESNTSLQRRTLTRTVLRDQYHAKRAFPAKDDVANRLCRRCGRKSDPTEDARGRAKQSRNHSDSKNHIHVLGHEYSESNHVCQHV